MDFSYFVIAKEAQLTMATEGVARHLSLQGAAITHTTFPWIATADKQPRDDNRNVTIE